MHAYFTFLGLFAIIIWPIAYIVAFIAAIIKVKPLARKMYDDGNEEGVRKKKRECVFNMAVTVMSVTLSVIIALLFTANSL